jgi:hypothetical protein
MRHAKAILVGLAVWVLLDVVLDFIVPDRVMNIMFVVTMSVVLVGVALVIYGTFAKNRWGLNFHPVNCPRCGESMPRVRVPRSRSQRLWGGCTCNNCGCEMDKWGREIETVLR